MQSEAASYTVMDPKNCLKAYSNIYISTYSDVILVSSDKNDSNSLLAWDDSFSLTSAWLCAPTTGFVDIEAPSGTDVVCDFKALEKDPSTWSTFGHPIKYCLAQQDLLDCTLEMSSSIMIVVLVTNAILLIIMASILTILRSVVQQALDCFGDVLASCLEVEDEHSLNMCLADKTRIEHFLTLRARGQASPFHRTPRRWYNAMTRGRIAIVAVLLIGGFIAVVICVAYALYIVHSDRKLAITWVGLLELGFGSTSVSGELDMNLQGSSMDALAVQSNIPQIFLAIIALVVNDAFIEMTQAASYARFAVSRKTLRVSVPAGK